MKQATGLIVVGLMVAACGTSSDAKASKDLDSFSYADLVDTSGFAPQISDNATLVESSVLFAPLAKLSKSGDLEYVQAESIKSTDNIDWTVTIHDGWTFHNGEPVTAQSYVDTWNYQAHGPNGASNNASFAMIDGYAATSPAEGDPTAKTLSGVKVVSPTQFTVRLSAADVNFPVQLTALEYAPMPKVAFADVKAYSLSPIGDGPYKVSEAKAGVSLTVERYADYQGKAGGSKEIVFKFFSSAGAAYTAVQSGTVDLGKVPTDRFTSVTTDFPDRHLVYATPSLSYLGLDATNPRLKSTEIRDAISQSIDRAAVNKAIFGGLNTPAEGITSKLFVGSPGNLCTYCTFDPEAAKSALAAAGGWSGGPLELLYVGGQGNDDYWTAIANQIKQNLGIEVKLDAAPNFGAYYTSLTTEGQQLDLFEGRETVASPSMGSILVPMFHPDGVVQFETHYSDPVATNLMAEAAASANQQDAAAKYIEAETTILAKAPIVPLVTYNNVYVWSSKISNVQGDVSMRLNLAEVTAAK